MNNFKKDSTCEQFTDLQTVPYHITNNCIFQYKRL